MDAGTFSARKDVRYNTFKMWYIIKIHKIHNIQTEIHKGGKIYRNKCQIPILIKLLIIYGMHYVDN